VQKADGPSRLSGALQDHSALSTVLTMMSQLNITLLSLARRGSIQKEQTMQTVISKDGTPIAFDQSGQGPALITTAFHHGSHARDQRWRGPGKHARGSASSRR
jgi:hypothetical protein